MRQEVDDSSRPLMTGRRRMESTIPWSQISVWSSMSLCVFTLAVRHWSRFSSAGCLYSSHPRDWAKKMNLACLGLITLPDTLNFLTNLPSLLPDVVTWRQMFIILNSYRQLAEMIISVLWSSGNLLEDWCLTFTTTELVSALELLCQCWNTDFRNEDTPVFNMWGHTDCLTSQLLTDKPKKICAVLWMYWASLKECDKHFDHLQIFLELLWESFHHVSSQ